MLLSGGFLFLAIIFAASTSLAADCDFGVSERFSLYCQLEQFERNIIPIEVAYSLDAAVKKMQSQTAF